MATSINSGPNGLIAEIEDTSVRFGGLYRVSYDANEARTRVTVAGPLGAGPERRQTVSAVLPEHVAANSAAARDTVVSLSRQAMSGYIESAPAVAASTSGYSKGNQNGA
jgi:hypothetical protein